MNGSDSFFSCVGLAIPPPKQASYFPAFHLFYTPGSRGGNYGEVPYSRTQHFDCNGAQTHNLMLMNPALIC